MTPLADDPADVHWAQEGIPASALWRSANGAPAPSSVVPVDDTITADAAYRLASQGVAMLWSGDFQNARQILTALEHRTRPRPDKSQRTTGELFYRYRQNRSHRARILGLLLIPMQAGNIIGLRRAPDVIAATVDAYGSISEASVVSLHEVLGTIGAHQWRTKGIPVAALNASIYPHYGTFFPVRSEYVDLVATAPLAAPNLAFDIGTGTGVLAAVLATRGVPRVIATDIEPRAVASARETMAQLGLSKRVEVQLGDLFPEGRADLIVCNPPWIPATAHSLLDAAVYDPGSRMLKGFLAGVRDHLQPGGEVWLVLSDFAELVGLRSRDDLLKVIDAAGLRVIGALDAPAVHSRATDASDSLHAVRANEVTSLWRLCAS
ncbi:MULTISPECIES: class I SAM-dependent methyltransferase [unclassified Cryobacterium]|uniref:methyltransferase n=1 Tax=unclassified Cryobacterium TaxID=2649013 RepID=UPI00106B255D|nr:MULTISPECIES: class I SAM-dependent methyltransferase [unclassified Cryobacterium]TFD08148.1 class I SAM-dependent methyltransferase [Cryobacterium sp. TMT1-66-1]TFD12196.1 class I SAM-dependent methyltransferase [Cryobacterium sp. TMT1-2-2]